MSKDRITRIEMVLKDIRNELLSELQKVNAEEFTWEPRPGMKSIKSMVREIATMEKICTHNLKTQQPLEWGTAVLWSGEDLASLIADIEAVRQETLSYLGAFGGDQDLDRPHPLLPQWRQYWWNQESVATEEMLRWIARHEYYHLGQIITTTWILGHNPYQT